MSRVYETNISDKYTDEISDLKKELIRLQAEEETNRKVNKILTGTQVGLCILLLLLKFI